MARLIKTDGTIERVTPANGKTFTLAELQGFVGGYIEIVPTVIGLDNPLHMYVNEEGLLKGMPYNEYATALLPAAYHRAGNVIVGDAILLRRNEEEKDDDGPTLS